MGYAFNIGGQVFFLPLNLSINSSKVHFFHCFIFTLFMKFAHFIFILGKNQKTTGALIQSMQNMQILISILIFKKSFDGVKMVTPSCMNNHTWGLINYNKVITFVNYIDW